MYVVCIWNRVRAAVSSQLFFITLTWLLDFRIIPYFHFQIIDWLYHGTSEKKKRERKSNSRTQDQMKISYKYNCCDITMFLSTSRDRWLRMVIRRSDFKWHVISNEFYNFWNKFKGVNVVVNLYGLSHYFLFILDQRPATCNITILSLKLNIFLK